MINNTIEGKSVFVTGGDGFIGSHLLELLVNRGAKVKALVNYNSWNEIGWLKDIPKNLLNEIQIIYGDIRDPDIIHSSIRECEYVFHLSSLISIPFSYVAPSSYIQTNVIGALNVLQACRQNDKLIRLLHVSTSEVYGSAKSIPISENHQLVAQSPYSASKIAADKLAESFNLSFNLPVVIARPFNTYGPRQTARAVIPTIASQLLGGCKTIKIGDLTPTRDFNYVTDTTRGLVELALCKAAEGLSVNIGSGKEWSIGETFDLLCKITKCNVENELDNKRIRPKNSEVTRLIADNSLIKKITNWKSEVSFPDGLKNTVDWISRNLDQFDLNHFSK